VRPSSPATLIQANQFAFRFDVEAMNAGVERGAHFRRSLADAGKHHFGGVAAGGQYARQFAAGYDVEAGAEAGEKIQDGEAGIGLNGKADQVRMRGQRLFIGAIGMFKCCARIEIAGGVKLRGDAVKRYILNDAAMPLRRVNAVMGLAPISGQVVLAPVRPVWQADTGRLSCRNRQARQLPQRRSAAGNNGKD
jgi:hypothetical protein